MPDQYSPDPELHELLTSVEFAPRAGFRARLRAQLADQLKTQRATGHHPSGGPRVRLPFNPPKLRRWRLPMLNTLAFGLTSVIVVGFVVGMLLVLPQTWASLTGLGSDVCDRKFGHRLSMSGPGLLPDYPIPITAAEANQLSHLMTLYGDPIWIVSLDISADRRMVAVSDVRDFGYNVFVWCLDTHMQAREIRNMLSGSVQFVDGSDYLLTAFMHGAGLWDVQSASLVKTAIPDDAYAQVFDYHEPSGTVLLGQSSPDKNHYQLLLWDPAEERILFALDQPAAIKAVAISPDGRWLAAALADGTLHVWNARTRAEVFRGKPTNRRITSLDFSPDSKSLALGSIDGVIRLWDVSARRTRLILADHEDRITGLRFSPDGSLLASGSYDGTVRLWDALTGETLAILEIESSSRFITPRVTAINFSPDGSLLAAGASDGGVWLWAILGE